MFEWYIELGKKLFETANKLQQIGSYNKNNTNAGCSRFY